MFGLFTSTQKRARHDAHNWLHLANKVRHFRRDQLADKEMQALQQAIHELRQRLRERADAAKLKMGMEKLEGVLRQTGGAYYPKSSLVDNVEFFLVALILFLGIRAFILQPFKIPTNSMWPTYHGLTSEVYVDPARAAAATPRDEFGTVELVPDTAEPGKLGDAFRLLLYGASARRLDAPVAGEIQIPWLEGYGPPRVPVSQRRWLVFPGQALQYTILVGGRPVNVTLPNDFRFEHLLTKAFFENSLGRSRAVEQALKEGRYGPEMPTAVSRGRIISRPFLLLNTGKRVSAGERVLSFDVLTGDQLFVDRFSYHFVPPKVGDGFVFRTHHISWIERGSETEFVDKYYIKRLVGTPGDTLEVRPPVLYHNGKPITGAAAFERNARQEGKFPGYTAGPPDPMYFMHPGEVVTVPERAFFAMGDNSPDSADSRFWGFVPEADVVGRPLWIYYPFTRRWGPAR
jgi:signal peptidase I